MLKKRKEDELKEAATKLAKDVEAEKAKLEEERKLEELRLKKKFQQDKEEAKKKEELKKIEDEKKAEEEEKLRKEQERRKAEEDNMKKKLEETMKRRKGMYYSIYQVHMARNPKIASSRVLGLTGFGARIPDLGNSKQSILKIIHDKLWKKRSKNVQIGEVR